MTQLIMISDDLTGALDSSVFFADKGFKVVTALGYANIQQAMNTGADVIAIVSGTREASEFSAISITNKICSFISGFKGIIFKKIDSRLKGHIDTELSILLNWFDRQILVVPAIPRLGRFVENGFLTGIGVPNPIKLNKKIGSMGTFPDVSSDQDIDELLPNDLSETLFVGSAGMAEAIARRLSTISNIKRNLNLNTPALFAIGSRDPITIAQINYLTNNPVLSAPNGIVPNIAKSEITMLRMTSGEQSVPGKVASKHFAVGVSSLVLSNNITTLFGCGGETAYAVLKQLKIKVIQVIGEVLPGVPVAHSINCSNELTIITKSGGFGEPDLLENLIIKLKS